MPTTHRWGDNFEQLPESKRSYWIDAQDRYDKDERPRTDKYENGEYKVGKGAPPWQRQRELWWNTLTPEQKLQSNTTEHKRQQREWYERRQSIKDQLVKFEVWQSPGKLADVGGRAYETDKMPSAQQPESYFKEGLVAAVATGRKIPLLRKAIPAAKVPIVLIADTVASMLGIGLQKNFDIDVPGYAPGKLIETKGIRAGKLFGATNPDLIFPSPHPEVENEDGSKSHVKLATYELDGKHWVLPTMVGGKDLSDDEVLRSAYKYGLDNYPSFDTAKEANAWAKTNHGKISGDNRPTGLLQWEGPTVGPAQSKAMKKAQKNKDTHAVSRWLLDQSRALGGDSGLHGLDRAVYLQQLLLNATGGDGQGIRMDVGLIDKILTEQYRSDQKAAVRNNMSRATGGLHGPM